MRSLISLGAALASLRGVAATTSLPSSTQPAQALPTVDLGYVLQSATVYNSSARTYNFSNIRYAAPPTGQLRFAAPQAPTVDRSQVQDGSLGRICPQGSPAWEVIAGEFLAEYYAGKPYDASPANIAAVNATVTAANLPQPDPRTTEDCLFLDVVVAESIFSQAGTGNRAPVLVWIYGGGYVNGDKSENNPSGLIQRSESFNMTGVIFVAFNYRLGAFGFSSGPTFNRNGGVPNAGLHDQRFALEWVQQHIDKFGGDPTRVTVMGESAGGGSVMHQITAFGGLRGAAPFAQAVLQSPGFLPVTTNYAEEAAFNTFLSLANASSIQELREASTETLQVANALHIGKSDYGNFNYGPTVGGSFVPALPSSLLSEGRFDTNVRVLVGHNSDEGILFTNPFVRNDSDLRSGALQTIFPAARPETIDYILTELYPPAPQNNGTLQYQSTIQRESLLIAESVFVCNTRYLDLAYGNQTYSYFFNVPPGQHGQDVGYTFYNDQGLDPDSMLYNTTVAIALQEYITSFAQGGIPLAPNFNGTTPLFQLYGADARVQDLNVTGIGPGADTAANARCDYWSLALYA